MRRLFPILLFVILAACAAEEISSPPLRVAQIVVSQEKIVEGQPLPIFSEYFEEGPKELYAYIIFENVATMTGSFPVRLQWFSPNDMTPPIGMSAITMTPPSSIAEFALHDDAGMKRGPYKVLVFAGEKSTATGSTRFFVGMTKESAAEFLKQEAEIERQREERRRGVEGLEGVEDPERSRGVKVQEELPPSLTDGVGEEP